MLICIFRIYAGGGAAVNEYVKNDNCFCKIFLLI